MNRNKSIAAVIIDDEKHCIELLKYELQNNCPDIEIVGSAQTGKEGIDLITNESPNLVFLDIEMPRMTGFDLLQELRDIDFHVIFVTAFDQYAIKAFKFSAIDYLLKPVDSENLVTAIEKIKDKVSKKINHDQFNLLLTNIKLRQSPAQKIAFQIGQTVEFVKIENIIRCESDGNYTYVMLSNQEKLYLSKTLKEVSAMLEEHGFLRVHQSHLINKEHINCYSKSEGDQFLMSDNSLIPISRSKKSLALKAIKLNDY